jgi:hypothetical protein
LGYAELSRNQRRLEAGRHGTNQMGSKSDTAWKTAARLAALAEETDDNEEREYFLRMRDAWITLANRCEPFDFPDVTEK